MSNGGLQDVSMEKGHADIEIILEELADELGLLGCKTILVTGDDRVPALEVVNGASARHSGQILVLEDCFQWAHAGVIASCHQVTSAAEAIAQALNATRAVARR